MLMADSLALRAVLAKIGKSCLSCTKCQEQADKRDCFQSVFDGVLEADIIIEEELSGEEWKTVSAFLGNMVNTCFDCDMRKALVHEKVSDFLLIFAGKKAVVFKRGNLYEICSARSKKKT